MSDILPKSNARSWRAITRSVKRQGSKCKQTQLRNFVAESILNAVAIYKKIRSTSVYRQRRTEYLYVIESPNLDGLAIYTKGKFVRESDFETYYFLISSKRAL